MAEEKDFPAKWTSSVAGKETNTCDDHDAKLAGLARGMGWPYRRWAIVFGSTPCANCVNEAKRRGEIK